MLEDEELDSDGTDTVIPSKPTLEELAQTVAQITSTLNTFVAQQTPSQHTTNIQNPNLTTRPLVYQFPQTILHSESTPQQSHYAVNYSDGLPVSIRLSDRIKAKIG